MPKAFFVVRATVDKALRDKLDHWYGNDHLPWALKEFKCEKAWRFWNEEGTLHQATYQFADLAALKAATNPDTMKALKADFDKNFPAVTRTREIMLLAQEA